MLQACQGERHNILNNLPCSLILINFHFANVNKPTLRFRVALGLLLVRESLDLQSFRFRGIQVSPTTGGRYTMEFKTKDAVTGVACLDGKKRRHEGPQYG
jgi:hypothetical protein